MLIKRLRFLVILICLMPVLLAAQQSSKSKSKSKIYEKTGENKNVEVKNVRALNSPNTDYSPTYYQNGVVYVSARSKNGPQAKETGEPYFDLYFSPFDPLGEPTIPEKFSVDLNSALHEGPVTFSRDWQTIFFTRSNMKNGHPVADKKGDVQLKIYEAKRGKNVWEGTRQLPFNSDEYTCMHPSLSADGKKLFFASDMPGGSGGYDIYVCERLGVGNWTVPRNLGPTVNTDKNDVFPFIHASGTLFFTSAGHNSIGGLDLFFAEPSGNKDEFVVTNLGQPYNSDKDDLGIIVNDDATSGYFSSNREPGFGKDDIYTFTVKNGIYGVQKPESRQIRLLVTDARSGQPLQGAAIRIFQTGEDGMLSGSTNDLYDVDLQPIEENGNALNFQLVRKNSSKLGAPDLFSNAAGEAIADFSMFRGYLLVVSAKGYRDGDKIFALEPESATTLIKIPLAEAEACAQTQGSVVTELAGRSLQNATLKFTNKNSGEQTLARTNQEGEFETCLPGEGAYSVAVEKLGFQPDNQEVVIKTGSDNKIEIRLKPNPIAPGVEVEQPVAPGHSIIMDNISYDQNQARLNQTAINQLDVFAKMMLDNPSMEIDLISHTDSQGDAKKNLSLSQERAYNAKKYLMHKGVAATRILAIGKGESELRNGCKDGVPCSEAEHQFNRRTEIRIRSGKGN